MNELKGLSQQEVQERIEQGQVNYTGQSISKTKKEIVKQAVLKGHVFPSDCYQLNRLVAQWPCD